MIRAKAYKNRKGTARLQLTMDAAEGKALAQSITKGKSSDLLKELGKALTEATR